MISLKPGPLPLQQTLSYSISCGSSAACRRLILNNCWGLNLSEKDFDEVSSRYSAYFEQYDQQCRVCVQQNLGQLQHGDVVEAFKKIRNGDKATVQSIVSQQLSTKYSNLSPSESDRLSRLVITHTACSLLHLDPSNWQDSETLHFFVNRTMLTPSHEKERVKLPKSFNARALDTIGGMTIRWTHLLNEHLRIEKDDTRVAIFHHATMLELLGMRFGDVFTEAFLQETGATISLALPKTDHRVRNWFKKQLKQNRIDAAAIKCTSLRKEQRKIQNFNFWRDRIVILKEVYDDHEPQNIPQLWRDDRRSVQWWTFWVAIVVFVIAIIQCVEGALQVYKAYCPQ